MFSIRLLKWFRNSWSIVSSLLGFSLLYPSKFMKTNFDALYSLLISFFPLTSSASGNEISSPSFAVAQRYLRTSAPCSSIVFCGEIPLFLDFDIFLESFPSIQPLIINSFHGFFL